MASSGVEELSWSWVSPGWRITEADTGIIGPFTSSIPALFCWVFCFFFFYSGAELSVRNTLHFPNCPFTQFFKLSTNMEQFSFVILALPQTLSALCTAVLCQCMDGQPEATT